MENRHRKRHVQKRVRVRNRKGMSEGENENERETDRQTNLRIIRFSTYHDNSTKQGMQCTISFLSY